MSADALATVEDVERALAEAVAECALLWLAEQPEAKRVWGTAAIDVFRKARSLYGSAVAIVRGRLVIESTDDRFAGFVAWSSEVRKARIDELAKRMGMLLGRRLEVKNLAQATPVDVRSYADAARELGGASAVLALPKRALPYRRDLDSSGAQEKLRGRMGDALRRFEAGVTRTLADDADDPTVLAVDWMLGGPAGEGLQLRVGPFAALPALPAVIELGRGTEVFVVPTEGLRYRSVGVAVGPAREALAWRTEGLSEEARGFLGEQTPPWLPEGAVTAFEAGGSRLLAATLTMGERYRLLVPGRREKAVREALPEAAWRGLAPEWSAAEFALPKETPVEMLDRLGALGFEVREAPVRVRLASLDTIGAVDGAGPTRLSRVRDDEDVRVTVAAPATQAEREMRVFVAGGEGHWAAHALDAGAQWTLDLGRLAVGRYVVRAVHERSTVPYGELLLEVLPTRGITAPVVEFGGTAWSVDGMRGCTLNLGVWFRFSKLRVRTSAGASAWVRWQGVERVFLGAVRADAEGWISLASLRDGIEALAAGDPVADLCVDLGVAGEVRIAHEAPLGDAVALERLRALVGAGKALFAEARGPLGQWRTTWFAPVCRALGYGVEVPSARDAIRREGMPDATVWRLVQARRAAFGARAEVVTVGALVVLPGGFAWKDDEGAAALAAEACERWRCGRALLTDGMRWAAYEPGRRRQAGRVDLAAALEGSEGSAMALLDVLAG